MGIGDGDAAASVHVSRVERYYDFIYHWSQITNRFNAFGKPAAYPIHRGLADPLTGEFSTSTVHRLVAEHIPRKSGLRGLDAGCGYAGSLIEMYGLVGGNWDGITISRRQVRVAQRNIERLGLSAAIGVSLASFDGPLPEERYDAVIAIESLIHSTSAARTMRRIAAALKEGGVLVLVDDMPASNVPAHLRADLDAFKRHWRCPQMPRADEWCEHLCHAGCEIAVVKDLTDLMRPRSEPETREALDELARKRLWRDMLGLALVSDAQEGGLRLERLVREKAVNYTMIVAQKKRRTTK